MLFIMVPKLFVGSAAETRLLRTCSPLSLGPMNALWAANILSLRVSRHDDLTFFFSWLGQSLVDASEVGVCVYVARCESEIKTAVIGMSICQQNGREQMNGISQPCK